MGTRNLTAVMVEGKWVVAQYGQWDGHPGGQGKTVLDFCKAHLATQAGRDDFKRRLSRVRFSKDETELKASTWMAEETDWSAGSPTFGKKLKKPYPHCGRDTGAGILDVIWHSEKPVVLTDSIDFAGDSLFCEYAYVIDLDKNVLEGFRGFNKSAPPKGERFAEVQREPKPDGSVSEYHPVKMMGAWPLDELPDFEAFASTVEPPGEDE